MSTGQRGAAGHAAPGCGPGVHHVCDPPGREPAALAAAVRLSIAIALACVLSACTDQSPDEPTRSIDLGEGPGSRLSAPDEVVTPGVTWDARGAWVYYVAFSAQGGRPYAARAGGGGRERLALGPAVPAAYGGTGVLRTMAPLPDGSVLWVVWPDTLSAQATAVLRWSKGDSVSWLPELQAARMIAAAGDPRFLVYESWDNALHAYDWTAGTSRRIGTGSVRAFGPGTPDLLLQRDDGAWFWYSLADGLERPVIWPIAEGGYRIVDVRWDKLGPHGLATRPAGAAATYALLDLSTNVMRDFYEYRFDAFVTSAQLVPGVASMTLWVTTITDPCTLRSGCVSHSALYVIDVADGAEHWTGGIRGGAPTALTFSPADRRSVYVAGGTLYVVRTPP